MSSVTNQRVAAAIPTDIPGAAARGILLAGLLSAVPWIGLAAWLCCG